MRPVGVALVAAALMVGQTASGQTRPELNGPSQMDINRQAAERFSMADKALNHAYRRLTRTATPEGRERLRQAQRAWLTFRDLDCDARAGARGGSFHPAAVMLCLEALTDLRTQTLRADLQCEEGDMGCGGDRED